MKVRVFKTPRDAYLVAVEELLYRPDFVCSPRGIECRELVNWMFQVVTPDGGAIETLDKERNKKIKAYHDAERELYLMGELDVNVWRDKASKFWTKVANPDGTINSNYGHLALYKKSVPDEPLGCSAKFITQWSWAKRSLLRDMESRQAFVRFSLPEHQYFSNKDQVCTMHMIFLVRDEHLHATTVMRSCDVVKGLVYDMPWFCYLLERMAEELGLPVGRYTHLAHSLHLYETDEDTALKMIGRKDRRQTRRTESES